MAITFSLDSPLAAQELLAALTLWHNLKHGRLENLEKLLKEGQFDRENLPALRQKLTTDAAFDTLSVALKKMKIEWFRLGPGQGLPALASPLDALRESLEMAVQFSAPVPANEAPKTVSAPPPAKAAPTTPTPTKASMPKTTPATSKWVIYSDGGCAPSNPGPAAWGLVVLAPEAEPAYHRGFIGHGTNQIAELTAAIEGLRRTPEGAEVELVSDSQYTLKGLGEWRAGWERRGFKNAKGDPVANRELWETLFALADARDVTTRWVKGHSGDRYNEKADEQANLALSEAAKRR